MSIKIKRDKKAVSIMIGYILLVTSAIVISVVVYQWIKTYVPTETVECADGVSIFLKDHSYTGDSLSITLKNNGRFNLAGYFIYATTDPDQEVAVTDLSDYTEREKIGNAISFGSLTANSFNPDEERINVFDLSSVDEIYSISIIPVRFQTEDNKKRLVNCGNAKISQDLSVEDCTPDCDGKECGPDGCGGSCASECEVDEICSNNICVSEEECTDTCSSLGYDCGSWIICGEITNCGTCEGSKTCEDGVCSSCASYCYSLGYDKSLSGCSSSCETVRGYDGDEYCSIPDSYCCCDISLECLSGQDIGDVDGDGDIDSFDADLASKIGIEISAPTNICCADADENSDIDILDGLLISQIASGQSSSPGVC